MAVIAVLPAGRSGASDILLRQIRLVGHARQPVTMARLAVILNDTGTGRNSNEKAYF